MISHPIPKHTCLCGHTLNRSTESRGDGDLPAEGDLTICVYCGQVWVFNKDLTQRILTLEDANKLPEDTQNDIARLQRLIKSLKPRHEHKTI